MLTWRALTGMLTDIEMEEIASGLELADGDVAMDGISTDMDETEAGADPPKDKESEWTGESGGMCAY